MYVGAPVHALNFNGNTTDSIGLHQFHLRVPFCSHSCQTKYSLKLFPFWEIKKITAENMKCLSNVKLIHFC